MKLTRDKIQRMVGSQGLVGSGAAGGGGTIGVTEQRVMEILQDYETIDALETTLENYVTTTALETTLANYATKTYVDQNYLSLSFFNALFQARTSQGATVAPNSGDVSTIDNIKAMFGFWTDQYLSALGQGADGGAITSLAALTDVQLSMPLADGEVLTYSTTLGKWTNGAGVSTAWANITGKPTTIAGYGITDAHITNGVITLGANTITPITSLTGYATETWVSTNYVSGTDLATTLADYVTTTALGTTLADYVTATSLSTTLADYATKNYVDQNYLSLSFFNALFQARTSAGVAVAPNSGDTTTIDNIKALFGFWTDQYLAALGYGSDSTAITSLAALTDVQLSTPLADGEVLTYSTTLGKWTNTPGGGGNYLPLSGGTMTGSILAGTNNAYNIGSSTAKFYYTYFHRVFGVQSIESSLDGTYRLTLPSKSGTIAVTSDLASYLPLSGGNMTGVINVNGYTSFGEVNNNFYVGNPSYPVIFRGNGIRIDNSSLEIYTDGGGTPTLYFQRGTIADEYTDWKISNSSGYMYFASRENGNDYTNRLYFTTAGNIYATGFIKINSSDSYVLLGGGGQAAISGLSVSYATTAGSASFASEATYANKLSSYNGIHYEGAKFTYGFLESSTDTSITDWLDNYGQITYISVPYSYADYGAQLMFSVNSRNVGFRKMQNGTWSSVFKIITSENIGSQSVSYATSAGTATDNTKLPLSGGTITGNLLIQSYSYANQLTLRRIETVVDSCIDFGNGGGSLGVIGITAAGLPFYSPVNSGAPQYALLHANNYSSYALPLSGGSITGDLSVSGKTTSSAAQIGLVEIRSGQNVIDAVNNYTLYINYFNSGNVVLGAGGGDVGISHNLTANGGISALSDIRHKDILDDTTIKVEDIARMRSVAYKWNDGRDDNEIHVGSIAQDWQSVLPEVVMRANDAEGTLSLQYGVAALISSITIARKVVNHEQRITELERECERLRFENEQLKLKIA